MTTPHAIIFDFDGVLLDTEWAIFHSWAMLYEREGCTLSLQEYAPCLGAGYTRWNPASHLEKLTGKSFDWDAENAVRQASVERELASYTLMPGAQELLEMCRTYGIRMVVASSSSRHWVSSWLARLQVADFFECLFCRTDGYAVKPDPTLFLAALKYLQVPASECLVIEDSENGVLAAKRANLPCVAIPNRMTAQSNLSAADFHSSSLHELSRALYSAIPAVPTQHT